MNTVISIVLILHCTVTVIAAAEKEGQFWLSADLIAIDWRHSCLNNGGCSDPRFKLQTSNLVTGEKLAIDWAIGDSLREKVRSFVSYWNAGLPDDIAINAEIVGIDPTYGFPRICDQSAVLRIFEKDTMEIEETTMHPTSNRFRRATELLNVVSSSQRTLLEIRGRCFNASLSIAKYDKNCPWCKEAVIETKLIPTDDPTSSDFLHQFKKSDYLLQIGLVGLALIAVISTTAFASLFVVVCSRRHRNFRQPSSSSNSTCTSHEYHERVPTSSNLVVKACRISNGSDENSKYETPWDQKFRPLPYWLKSDILHCPGGVRPKSPDTVSLHGTNTSERTVTTTIERSPHVSPNSSIDGGRHNDSGLETV